MSNLKETVQDLVSRVPLDKLHLDKIDTRALTRIDPKKVAPFALMLARRSWPLAIALGVGAAAYTAYRYTQNHKSALA